MAEDTPHPDGVKPPTPAELEEDRKKVAAFRAQSLREIEDGTVDREIAAYLNAIEGR